MTPTEESRPARRVDVCRLQDARVLMEGDELALIYFHTDKLVFTASVLPPGARSNRDPGHPGADEVVYCVAGQAVIEIGEGDGEFVMLRAGEAALIHDGVPHAAFNPGPDQAEMIWAVAPHLGRPLLHDA